MALSEINRLDILLLYFFLFFLHWFVLDFKCHVSSGVI